MNLAKPLPRFISFLIDACATVAFLIGLHFLIKNDNFIYELNILFNNPITFDSFLNFLTNISNQKSFLYFLGMLLYQNIYYVVIPLLFRGKTIGRMFLRLRITQLDESKPTFGNLLIREIIVNFIFAIFTLGLIYLVDLLISIFDKGRRSIADRMSNTLVMKDEYYLTRRRK